MVPLQIGQFVVNAMETLREDPEPGAVLAFQAALRGDPDNVEARFMLARRALAAKDFDQAKRWLAEISDLDARGGAGRRGAGEIQR